MDSERRLVEKIFHQALEREGLSRAAFLDGACPDPNLRREVEALLENAGNAPAAPDLSRGTHLGPYRIEGRIGAGGMGTVYKAVDTRLNRRVAIKISAARFSARFAREARAIAALNHPYVCTLYDIGPNYLVMEYVDGVILKDLLRSRKLPLEEVLQYALQIAAAMQAAHAAGIIHRDLKPGNVMVTGAGLIKVLDFGLAKIIARAPAEQGEITATMVVDNDTQFTRPGVIMGSSGYMSPEQALGKTLETPSDVFSFGIVLYEMLAGRRAFAGDSTIEILSSIIHLDLPAPSTVNRDVPGEVDALVAHCLRKDPEQRATMAELHRELKVMIAGTSSSFTGKHTVRPEPAKRQWMPRLVVIAFVVLAAAGFLIWRKFPIAAPEDSGGVPEMMRVTSDPGLSIAPAVSEDGKFVAYASDRGGEGNLDIWVKQIGGGDPLQITRNPADDTEPDFSPDGTHIVFRSERDGGGIYIVPTTGGEERRIADGGRRPRFSPDGTKILYWTGRADPFPLSRGNGKIFVLDLAANTTRRIRPDFTAAVHPVWSPDGSKILFEGANDSVHDLDWWITPLGEGAPVSIPVTPDLNWFDPFCWQGNQVYFEWYGPEVQSIGRLTIDVARGRALGKPRRLTAGTADAYSPAVSKTGEVIFSVLDTTANLYGLPLDANEGKPKGRPERLSKERGLNIARSISADGARLAFATNRLDAKWQIWGRDLSTGQEHALTEGGDSKVQAEISADGRFVVWREALNTKRKLFVTSFDGGTTRELCSNCGMALAWSPDSRFVLYDQVGSHWSVGLLELASGKTSTYLERDGADLHARSISRDGKWVVFTAEHSPSDFRVYVAPFSAERPPPPEEWIEVISGPDVDRDPHWSPDGNLLYFTSQQDGYNCLWALHLDRRTKRPQGELFPVEHFHAPSLLLEAPSSEYPELALSRDKIIISLKERSGGIWEVKPGAK